MVKVLVTVKAGNINMDKLIQLIQSRSIKAFGKKKKKCVCESGVNGNGLIDLTN